MTIFNFNNYFLIELYRQTKHNNIGWGHKTNSIKLQIKHVLYESYTNHFQDKVLDIY
jgi:hypothetical protein